MKTRQIIAVLLCILMLGNLFPDSVFAEDSGQPLALRFLCDETVATVSVYDADGQALPVGEDGIHHLAPGSYYYTAEAEGFESAVMQPFMIPEDAAGDQELRITLVPVSEDVPVLSEAEPFPATEEEPEQNQVIVEDTDVLSEKPEDDGRLRIRPVDGSLTLTIDGEIETGSAVPTELQALVGEKDTPVPEAAADGGSEPADPEAKLFLKTPDAEELYLDRLALEKELGFYTADWTIVNLVDEDGERKEMTSPNGSFDVTVSGPAMDKYASYRPVFALLTLHWDENGDISDRDVSILEVSATPTQSSYSFQTDRLSTLLIAIPTGMPVEENTTDTGPDRVQRTLTAMDGRVTVSGILPEDAELVVVEIPYGFAADLYSSRTGEATSTDQILFAYDISILSDGRKYQPEDFGESVRVSITGLSPDSADTGVLHLKADATNEAGYIDASSMAMASMAESEVLPSETYGSTVSFDVSDFSVFIGASAAAETTVPGEAPVAPPVPAPGVVYLTQEQTLGDLTVTAQIPQGAMSEYAKLTLRPADAEAAEKTILDQVNANFDASAKRMQIASMALIDISFEAGDYAQYPSEPVIVTLQSETVKYMTAPRLYHLINGQAQKLDAAFDTASGTVSFATASFSPFAVVDLVEEGSVPAMQAAAAPAQPVTLSPEKVTVSYADVSGVADTLGLENTEAVPVPAAKKLLKRSSAPERFTRSGYVGLDVSVDPALLTAGGEYLVPVTLPDPVDLTGVKNAVIDRLDVQVYHVVGDKAVPVEASFTAENGILTDLTIVTDGFSPYIVSYTVEFHNGDTEVVVEGGTQVLLSTLIMELGLTRPDGSSFTVDEVAEVSFRTPELFKVEEVTGENAGGSFAVVLNAGTEREQTVEITTKHNFVLTSQQPFTADQMILTFTDGTTTEIEVTDVTESTDLSNFLTNAVITGATQDEQGYHVTAGTEYTILLSFAESTSYQFNNAAELTYDMPAGIRVLNAQSGDFKVNIVYKGRTYQVDANYTLGTDGHLIIKFDENDPDYHHLLDTTNVSFRFTYEALFDGSTEEIEFNDEIERTIVFDEPEPPQAYANKSAVFDETTGTFYYTITVTATGAVTNVNVKDVISGDALIFNNDVQVSGNSSSYTNNGASNGFDYTFASMAEGETITITYSASVDFTKDSDKDGKISVDQTKNTATVQPKDGDPHSSEYSHEIAFKTTRKSNGTLDSTTQDGDKIYKWTITYNELRLASAAGDTIKDTIAAGSTDYMKYYGEGLSIKVIDKNGNIVNRFVPYENLQSYSDSSWTYQIPDSDTEPYMYEITYYTVVDMDKVNGIGNTVTVSNDANGSYGSTGVTPDSEIAVTKSVDSFTTEEVTWTITLGVPESGLTQAVVTDTLPHIWLNGSNHYDIYKDGSLEITGLLAGESYTVDTTTTGQVKITFYKDAGKTQTGLQGTPGGHTITVKLTTKVDQEWLQKGYETQGYEQTHTNSVDFNGKTDTAWVIFGEPGIEKSGEYLGNGSFKYTVVMAGVSATPVSVLDAFDTSILEVDTSSSEWDHMQIWGGTQYYQGEGKTPITYTDTGEGIILTANSVPMQADGTYYPYYKIVYYLKLKDGVDLEALAIANGGEYDITNTAQWGDHDSECTYTFEYNYLDKELLNSGNLGGTNRTAQYQITFNAAKATLNKGEPMTMTDTISDNLSVDYSSIQIVTDPAGAPVPYSLKGGPNGTTIATYTVPDSTKVVITYNADVRGNGSQKIVNKVSVNGRDKTVEETKDYGSASEGEGAKASFKIVKVDGYDANKKLSGVKFKVFCENSEVDFGVKADHAKEIFLITNQDGEITFDADQYDFYFGECYHVQEVDALEDYGTISFDYLVTLTNDMALVDYGQYIYYYSDSMQIKNWPLEGLVVEKQVESDDEDDYERYYSFRVSILNEDGSVNTDYNEQNGDDQFENGVAEFQLKAGEQKMFWGFAKGTKYKVEEVFNEGKENEFTTTVSYDVFDEDGNVTEHKTENATSHTGELTQEDEVIVFKNSKGQTGSLKITKNVTENGSTTLSDAAKSKLAGTYQFTIYTDESCTTPYQVNGSAVTVSLIIPETGAAATSEEVTDLPAGDYWIKETTPTNGSAPITNPVKVTVEAGKTGNEAVVATFTNNYETVNAKVKKVWVPADNVPASLKVKLSNDTEVTLNAGNNWEATVEHLPKYDSNGEAIMYTWTEDQLPSGYYLSNTATTESADTATGVITNTTTLTNSKSDEYNPTTTIKGKKVWHDDGVGRPASITVELYQNEVSGNPFRSITVQAPSGEGANPDEWPFEFTNLPVFNPDGSVIQYIVKEVLPEGYTSIYGVKVEFEQATYIPGEMTGEIVNSGQGGQTFDISRASDLGYIVIRHGNDFIIWTPRPASPDEISDIKTKVVSLSDQFNGITSASGDSLKIISGVPKTVDVGKKHAVSVYMDGDTVKMTFLDPSAWSDFTYGKIPYTYTPAGGQGGGTITNTDKNAYVELSATKVFTGREWKEGETFEFTLAAVEGNPNGAALPTTLKKTATKDAQTVTFDKIRFTKAGVYTFTITETEGDLEGVTYDTDPKAITVNVTAGEDGTLSATCDPESATVTATNTYAAEGEAELKAIKEVSGAQWPSGATVTFSVAAATQGAPMPEQSSVTLTAAGTANFGKINFTLDDAGKTYQYTITESAQGFGNGWAANPTSITVEMAVTDNGDGTLNTDVSYTPEDATVTNTYTASGTATLKATKAVEGADWPSGAKVTFTLSGDNAPMPDTTTATLTGAGAVSFGPIGYTESDAGKTYQYTITETAEGFGNGWSANPTSITAKVAVTDNGDGTLNTDVTYSPENATITNTYSSGNLTIKKTVTGNLGDRNKEFKFTIELGADGEFTYTGDRSGTISSGGTILLKHGESVTIEGIPTGTEYKITESDNANYRVYTTGTVGVIVKDETVVAAFTNNRSNVPSTGEDNSRLTGLLMMLFSGLGMAATPFFGRKRRSKARH